MPLAPKHKQQLKAKAHQLKPIIFIGNNGLTENVMQEIDRGLTDHELIKIRIIAEDRDLKREMFAEICLTHHAEPVQLIGNIATIYRKNQS
jgi:RNA-binding protein